MMHFSKQFSEFVDGKVTPHSSEHKLSLYIRNIIFGIEDGLVSTVGLLSGIAFVGEDRKVILLTGLVLICVEAFSMGVGSLLSEHSTEEFEEHRETPFYQSILVGIVMFVSYFIAGFVPLFPYILFSPAVAFWLSIGLSVVALFILGLTSAKLFGIRLMKQGLQMAVLGGLAILMGIIVGKLIV